MKLTLERDALHSALGRVAKIVERKSTIPILTHLRLETRGDFLALKGTDLDLEAETAVPADTAVPGLMTAPAATLSDIVAKVPAGAQIVLEAQDGRLVLRASRSKFTLQTVPPEDFPDTGEKSFSHHFEIAASMLGEMIGKTEFAISNEETRYYLNGIYLHVREVEGHSMLRAVATDGHRLARIEFAAPTGAAGMPAIIVPRKAVGEIKRLAKDATGAIGFDINDRLAKVTIPGKVSTTVLTTKLIDGTYPDYERVIPRGNDKIALIDRASFMSAVDRVSCISSAHGCGTRLAFGDRKLILSVNNPDAGEAADEIDADYESAPIEIGFNSKYLGEVLSVLGSENAEIALADPGSPTLFRERAGGALVIVLMPMRI
jgi:DNA polymerase-3 subunit beta